MSTTGEEPSWSGALAGRPVSANDAVAHGSLAALLDQPAKVSGFASPLPLERPMVSRRDGTGRFVDDGGASGWVEGFDVGVGAELDE